MTRGVPGSVVASTFMVLRRHPGRVLAMAACFAMAGGIVGNAMLFQSGRHPAPLFGQAPSARQAADQAASDVPLPAPRPATSPPVRPAEARSPDRKPEGDVPASAVPRAPTAVPGSTRPPLAKAATPHKEDAIAQLLRGTDKPSATVTDVDSHVLSAQRALEKLGFAVKPDGRMGNSTRLALEKFQRDHHVPAGDTLSPRLLRELSTAARLPPG